MTTNNECGIGDIVRVMETRPVQGQERWRVVEIIEGKVRRQHNDSAGKDYLKVADNTGAKEIKCIRVLGGSSADTQHRRRGRSFRPQGCSRRLCQEGRRRQGSYRAHGKVRPPRRWHLFALTRTQRSLSTEPIRTPRHSYLWTVARELRDKDYMKILSLAPRSDLREGTENEN